jgi:hypothetical protein
MAKPTRRLKQRRTFTLSPESLAYLEQEARRRNADSQSAVLDELLQEKDRERQLAALEAATTAYYDSLSDAEVEENRAWGELAEQSLILKDDEDFYDQPTARGNLVHTVANRPPGKRKAPRGNRVDQRPQQSSAR